MRHGRHGRFAYASNQCPRPSTTEREKVQLAGWPVTSGLACRASRSHGRGFANPALFRANDGHAIGQTPLKNSVFSDNSLQGYD